MGEHQITRRAVFLDRDGVLNRPLVRHGQPYPPATPDECEIYPDAIEGSKRLHAADFLLVVVTNQPDVGRGTQKKETVEAIHRKVRAAIPEIDHVAICFHAGELHGEVCDCRKPKTGMLLRAASEMGIDLAASYFIGDRWRDVDCARAAGCKAVFIDRGYNERLRTTPDFTVASFGEAADAVLCDARSALDSSQA